MIRLLDRLRGRLESAKPAPEFLPGARMYCIGDIHGRFDLLTELHQKILDDRAGYEGTVHLLYIGDYIDRGPQSREVVDLLLERPLAGFTHTFLRGNHEQALLDFLEYPREASVWLTFGGRETLASYGVTVPPRPAIVEMQALADKLAEVLPGTHLAFYRDCLLNWQGGDYHFVHAGIRPGVPLNEQDQDDQLWIREEFTHSGRDHGAVIVHGHTISPQPEELPNRIGIDTGAFHTGILTCLVLEGAKRRFLQTGCRRVGP